MFNTITTVKSTAVLVRRFNHKPNRLMKVFLRTLPPQFSDQVHREVKPVRWLKIFVNFVSIEEANPLDELRVYLLVGKC